MYNKVKNDASDAYPYDAIVKVAEDKHKKPDHDMQMICYIKEEKNVD